MDYRRFGNTVVVRVDRYEEVMEKIQEICEKEGILLGSISGLGCLEASPVSVLPAMWRWDCTMLRKRLLQEQFWNSRWK